MKKLVRYLPTHFLLCLIAGICIEFYLNFWIFSFNKLLLLLSISIILLILFHHYKKKLLFIMTTSFSFIIIGISCIYLNNSKNTSNYFEKFNKNDATITLLINKKLKANNYYSKYIATVSQVNSNITKGEILLNIKKDSFSTTLNIGSQILVKSNLKEIKPPLNPHQFNYKNYLKKQGITYQTFINNREYRVLKSKKHSVKIFFSNIKKQIQQSISKKGFSKNELAVINALLLGDKQQISNELRDRYAKAGAIHILAISGLHIGILFLILSSLLTPLKHIKNGLLIKTILVISLLWLFAMLTGFSASVTRAVTMFSFISLGRLFKRDTPVEYSLIASMFLLLIISPLFLFDIGFQLSYFAVFSIVWLQPLLYNIWNPKTILTRKIWQLSTVSIAAQIGVLPISLYYFHQFPSLFLISNLIIIPFLGIILSIGFIIVILTTINYVPNFLVAIYSFIIRQMNTIIDWISNQETFLFSEISMSLLQMIAWYLCIIAFTTLSLKKTITKFILFLSCILIFQTVYFIEKYNRDTKNEFILFHKNKHSVVGNRIGRNTEIISDLDTTLLKQEKFLNSYKTNKNTLFQYKKESNSVLKINTNYLLFIDSLGVYPKKHLENLIVVLEYSPKINLIRLIKTIKPKKIIANGTNYRTYVNRWKITCKKQKTPFHFTGENGAYILRY